MNKNSNTYIFLYAVAMVVVVALLLSFIATQLRPLQEKNIATEKKRNILSAIHIETTAENAAALFDKYIVEMIAVNAAGEKIEGIDVFSVELKNELYKNEAERLLPVFVAKTDDNALKYILPLHGKGLWGPIWGYMALDADLNTVYGVVFSHKGETPGLGAEIDTRIFQQQFNGKQIFDAAGQFVSVKVLKEGAPGEPIHSVDAISGGTITSNGLQDMLSDCLKLYLNYINKNAK